MEEEIRIEIPGRPVPWSVDIRRRGGRGVLVTPERLGIWQEAAALFARVAMRGKKTIEGPVKFSMVAIFPIPKDWNKAKRQDAIDGKVLHKVQPDMTNLLKATEDSLTTAKVWTDDGLVCRQETAKLYGEKPGVYVVVTPIEEVKDER